MVLQQWIVPEPDPALNISISNIDITKLTYTDIKWILGSTMKKYNNEFFQLPGFIEYSKQLIEKERNKEKEKYIGTPKNTPPPIFKKEQYIKIRSHNPLKNIPFMKKPKKMRDEISVCTIH